MDKIVELQTGTLRLSIRRSHPQWSVDRLCGFGCRQNPRRPFLVVSKILGKHVASDPSDLVTASEHLVEDLGELQTGPVCVIGMAETATSLSQTFHERLVAVSERRDVLYLPTTRYQLDHEVAFRLEETHSHATSHLVYWPTEQAHRSLMRQATTLVIVDDEFTTGNTAANLIKAARDAMPSLQNVAMVCLTNWMTDQARRACVDFVAAQVGHCTFHALLDGTLQFESRGVDLQPAAPAVGDSSSRSWCLPTDCGRLGMTRRVRVDFDSLLGDRRRKHNVAVVGTGEYMYVPSLLARELQRRGHHVTIQSTTRSPVLVAGKIESAITFVDNYHDGIANFLYNYRSALATEDRDVIVCYETTPIAPSHDLVGTLGAELAFPNQYILLCDAGEIP